MSSDNTPASTAAKPKAQPAVGILLLCLDALLVAGLLTFGGPCDHLEGAVLSSCQFASRVVLAVGTVIGILAVVRIFETDEGERRGLSLSAALLGALCRYLFHLTNSLNEAYRLPISESQIIAITPFPA